jgi:uncharacterized membrane protein YedE/YeeE
MLIMLSSIGLAALLGFASHRASNCTVRAVAELMNTGHGHILMRIAKSVLWVFAITIPFLWLMPEPPGDQKEWTLSALTLVGGAIYGIGAAINGGCAFSTLNQLADGKLRMLGALLGFCLGVVIVVAFARSGNFPLPSPIQLDPLSRFLLSLAVAVGLALWCVYEVMRLWITRRRDVKFMNLLLFERYRLSTAAALMGISNAMLYLTYCSWSYSGTLQQGIESLFSNGDWPQPIRWILFAAMLGGMITSTLQRRSFHFAWRPSLAWLRNFGGGTLMGVGAVLIPGGNDTLILHGIPTNSPNALPAYIAMLAGIAIALVVMRFLTNVEIKVECGGDVCVIEDPHNS